MAEEKKEKAPLNKSGLKKLMGVFSYIIPYKVPFIVGLICLFISNFLVLGFPVLSGKLLDVAAGKSFSVSPSDLLSRNEGVSDQASVWVVENITEVTLILMVILLVQSVFSFARVYLFAIVSERAIADLREAVFTKMLNLPLKFFDNSRVGDMISRITSDIAIIQETVSITLAEMFRQITMLVIGTIIIFVIIPELALFMLAIFPAVIFLAVIFGRSIRRLTKKSQGHLGDTNVIVDETLQSILVVKAFTNELFEIRRYRESISKAVSVALHTAKYRGGFISFVIFSLFGAIVAVMWKGASLVNENAITSGELVTFVLVTMFIGASIAGIGDMIGQIQRAVGSSQRILDVMDEENEEVGNIDPHENIEGKVAFRNVSFQYPDTETMVLKNINFEVNPGEKIALVGPSGAGKSTITQLLMRFYPLTEGDIRVDGKAAKDFSLSTYRSHIGVVPQEVLLFGGSIRENIGYGKPGASDKEIRDAAEKANILAFIETLDEGMNTKVGERGVKLSGGQRQRIAIARAILKDPAILILDEATSNLDAESEILVQEALEKLMENRTTIIIAHRLSTIRSVNQILVIKNGELIESGNHEELKDKKDGLYSHLLKLQFQLQ